MSQDLTLFQYCQKLVVLNKELNKVLLAKRKGEDDYDATYSFIGGKLETQDKDLIAGLKREKDEEVGKKVKLRVLPNPTYNEFFVKQSGQKMILPHYAAVFESGGIKLNHEYSEYSWVKLAELDGLEPKIPNIPLVSAWAVETMKNSLSNNWIEI